MERTTRAWVTRVVVALGLLCAPIGCGVVRYRQMTITVRNEVTNAPVSNVNVAAQMMGVMLQFNADKVPLRQDGTTDKNGVWKVTLPTKQAGWLVVDRIGYELKTVDIQEDTFDDGKVEVKLTPKKDTSHDGRSQGNVSPQESPAG
jgi:hypothetical protein